MNSARGVAALVRLELATRAPILAAALFVGVAAIPLAIATRQQPVVFAVALALAFCAGSASLLGASMLAEPIAQGRVGFFFSQPLTAGALWWGRLLGATLVAIGAAVAAVAPAWIWRVARIEPSERQALDLLALALLAALPLAAICHALATLLRVRSARAAIDFAALLGVAALGGWSARTLSEAALDGRWAWVPTLAAAPLLAVAAGQAQLSRGRGDVERGHVALSATLWLPLLLVTMGTVAGASWVTDIEPGDVEFPPFGPVTAAESSHWVVIGGVVLESRGTISRFRQGLYGQFLVDVETGDWARLGPPLHWERQRRFPAAAPTLAEDGSRIVWRARDGAALWANLPTRSSPREPGGSPSELRLAPLALPPDLSDARVWALSPDGRFLAAALAGTRSVTTGNGIARYLRALHVIELPGGEPVFSEALPWPSKDPDAAELGFDTGRDALSLNLRWQGTTRIELVACLVPRARYRPDAVTHAAGPEQPVHAAFAALALTGAERSTFSEVRSFPEPACGRLVVSRDGQLATNSPEWWASESWASRLRDTNGSPPVSLDSPGRRALSVTIGDTWVAQLSAADANVGYYLSDVRLRWFDRAGQELGEIALGDRVHARFGGEVAGKLLLLTSVPLDADAAAGGAQRQRLLLFDPRSGTLEPLAAPTLPDVAQYWPAGEGGVEWMLGGRLGWSPAPGSLATKLYFGNDGSLVLLDAEEGIFRVVHAPRGSSSLAGG